MTQQWPAGENMLLAHYYDTNHKMMEGSENCQEIGPQVSLSGQWLVTTPAELQAPLNRSLSPNQINQS